MIKKNKNYATMINDVHYREPAITISELCQITLTHHQRNFTCRVIIRYAPLHRIKKLYPLATLISVRYALNKSLAVPKRRRIYHRDGVRGRRFRLYACASRGRKYMECEILSPLSSPLSPKTSTTYLSSRDGLVSCNISSPWIKLPPRPNCQILIISLHPNHPPFTPR